MTHYRLKPSKFGLHFVVERWDRWLWFLGRWRIVTTLEYTDGFERAVVQDMEAQRIRSTLPHNVVAYRTYGKGDPLAGRLVIEPRPA